MISAASSKRAVVLCLLQSLAGVIFGWSNAEGSGLVSLEAAAAVRASLTKRSSRWVLIRGDSVNHLDLEEHTLSAPLGRVPSLVSWLLVLPSVPSDQVSLPIG